MSELSNPFEPLHGLWMFCNLCLAAVLPIVVLHRYWGVYSSLAKFLVLLPEVLVFPSPETKAAAKVNIRAVISGGYEPAYMLLAAVFLSLALTNLGVKLSTK